MRRREIAQLTVCYNAGFYSFVSFLVICIQVTVEGPQYILADMLFSHLIPQLCYVLLVGNAIRSARNVEAIEVTSPFAHSVYRKVYSSLSPLHFVFAIPM
jgi:hypothetical protein